MSQRLFGFFNAVIWLRVALVESAAKDARIMALEAEVASLRRFPSAPTGFNGSSSNSPGTIPTNPNAEQPPPWKPLPPMATPLR